MKLPCGRLKRLKKCRGYIEDRMISQAEYWALETAWAARAVVEAGEPWQWTSLRRHTHMRRENLRVCLPYLEKYVDEETVKRIRELVE